MPDTALVDLSHSLEAAITRAAASTVLVSARQRIGASGIVGAPDTIVTAAHVLQDAESITIGFPDGSQEEAELVGADPGTDVAVLRVPGGAAVVAPRADMPGVGALALTLGRPRLGPPQASLGIISAVGGPWRSRTGYTVMSYLQTDAQMLPGFSGGPLVGGDGATFGMTTSALARDGGTAIPWTALDPIVNAFLSHGRLRRAFLGVATQPIALARAGAPDSISQERGLLVTACDADGPAAAAGVFLGDVLLTFAEAPLQDTDDLLAALGADRIGEAHVLEVLRAGALQRLDVTPTERD
jgi:S1-C subfamily serine protease